MSVVWYFYFQSNYFFNVSNGFGFALEKTKLDFHLEITSEFSNSTCHLHKITKLHLVKLCFSFFLKTNVSKLFLKRDQGREI